MDEILTLRRLTKVYDEALTAVDGIDLAIRRKEMFGFLGPNGAGKTTTLNMVCGLARPTAGTVELDGMSLLTEREEYLGKIGLISQHFNIDPDLTAYENMLIHAYLYRLRGRETRGRIDRLLRYAGLQEYRDKIVRTFSGGMKRKLQIVRAILHRPEILFLDEPTAGLDAHARERIWNLIKDLNGEGMTVFFSTHYIEEAEQYAHRVGIIHKGAILRLDEPRSLIDEIGPWCRETFTGGLTERRYFSARNEAERGGEEKGSGPAGPSASRDPTAKHGTAGVREYSTLIIRETQLEDVFIHLTGEESLS
jgi:ABC-2 type transport system ATP-binding protein